MRVALEVVADLLQEPQAAQPRFRGTLRLECVQASQCGTVWGVRSLHHANAAERRCSRRAPATRTALQTNAPFLSRSDSAADVASQGAALAWSAPKLARKPPSWAGRRKRSAEGTRCAVRRRPAGEPGGCPERA